MENDYRITKLHGTLIGDNRIPALPDGETTKVFSSTNGKTAWVCKICGYVYEGEELPTDYICPLCKHPASDFEKTVR